LIVLGFAVTGIYYALLFSFLNAHAALYGKKNPAEPRWLWIVAALGPLVVSWLFMGYVILLRHVPWELPFWFVAPYYLVYCSVASGLACVCLGALCSDDTRPQAAFIWLFRISLAMLIAGGVWLVTAHVAARIWLYSLADKEAAAPKTHPAPRPSRIDGETTGREAA